MSTGTDTPDVRAVGFSQAVQIINAGIESDTPIALGGAPGVGKTDLAKQLARFTGRKLVTLILSVREPADIGGFPVARMNGDGKPASLDFLPMGAIKMACKEPCLLFLDEIDKASQGLQAGALAVVLDRRAGDVDLHPDTRILLAYNPTQYAGGHRIMAPLVNRACFLELRPTLQDFLHYLHVRSGAAVPGETTQGVTPWSDPALCTLALDLAVTAEQKPELVELTPPPGGQGAPWASPRAWVQGLRLLTALEKQGISDQDITWLQALAGCVGDSRAVGYHAVRKLRIDLPVPGEIVKDPMGAKCPDPENIEQGIAALGLVIQAARLGKDAVWAAWAYSSRLNPEMQLALGSAIMRNGFNTHDRNTKAPHYNIGARVRSRFCKANSLFTQKKRAEAIEVLSTDYMHDDFASMVLK